MEIQRTISQMFHDLSVKSFQESTVKYFGKEEIISKIEKNYVSFESRPTKLHIKSLLSISIFYNWRINNGRNYRNPLIDDDYNFLQNLLNKGTINLSALSFIFGVSESALRANFYHTKSLKISSIKIKGGRSSKAEIFEWDGLKGNALFWSNYLEMNISTFRARIYQHGICYLSFITKDEYSKVPISEKRKYINIIGKRVIQEVDKEKESIPKDKKFNDEKFQTITIESFTKFVTGLIIDSKDNLIETTKVSKKYFEESQNFLMNKNGMLEYYLNLIECVDIDCALESLYRFATVDYLLLRKE
jgi:hypothetical protein